MIRAVSASIVLLLGACSTPAPPFAEYLPGGPSARTIAELEARVVMPDGAEPVSAYLRTYYPHGAKVAGLYRLESRTGIRSVPTLDVMVMDGGCGVVTVIYEPMTKVIEEAYCNGVA